MKFERIAVFYGRDVDTQVAMKVFKSLLTTAQFGIRKYSQQFYKIHGTRKGVEKAYAYGFCKAVKEELESNCRALCLIIPQEVEDKFKLTYSKTRKRTLSGVNYRRQDADDIKAVYNQGQNDGKEAAQEENFNKAYKKRADISALL